MEVTEKDGYNKVIKFARLLPIARSIVQPDRGRREVLRVVERVRGDRENFTQYSYFQRNRFRIKI